MSQLIKITFNEAVPTGDEVYPHRFTMYLPAEQVFGSHARRQLAPFDLFDSGLGLVTEIDRGYYRLTHDMEIEIGPRTIRQTDSFYYTLPTSPAFGWFGAIVNQDGTFTLRQSDLSILAENTVLKPGVVNTVNLTFFYQGKPIVVTGPGLTPAANGTFDLDVTAPMKPGAWQSSVEFTYEGIDYDYPMSFSVLQPGLEIQNLTPSMKAGLKGLFYFSVVRDTGVKSYPEVKIASAAIDGGTAGELHSLDKDRGRWGMELTPKDIVFTMNLRLVLDIDGWRVPWSTYVVVTQKDASSDIVDGEVLKLNLTQVVKLRIMSESKPVANLTTKSLQLSGSPSYHTYSKTLVKLSDGLYQFSIYTNNVQGTMYADIVVTIDGVDLTLPRFPITVRA